MVKISIITVNYNNKIGLSKTLDSVLKQEFKEFEYLIIDGGSTDGSAALLQEKSNQITYWVSEKDSGIYNAMNKGIAKATGDYLIFLNSGDCLHNIEVIARCYQALKVFPEADILYGDTLVVNDSRVLVDWVNHYPKTLDLLYFQGETINHQASLIKAYLFDEFGCYPESYRMASDFWLYLKSSLNNKKFVHIGFTMVDYDLGGISSKSYAAYTKERTDIWKNVVPAYIRQIITENENYEQIAQYKIVRVALSIRNFYHRVRGLVNK